MSEDQLHEVLRALSADLAAVQREVDRTGRRLALAQEALREREARRGGRPWVTGRP